MLVEQNDATLDVLQRVDNNIDVFDLGSVDDIHV